MLSGNEAIALGAYEAGVQVASSYPGTPATEIIESLAAHRNVSTEWAPNEKVSLEVAMGASFAGARAMASMKHVGLNVAADPLFTSAYTGVRGGLVIVTADDPGMHSSQNEQDNRNYAFAAKVPMLEPSDPEEAKEFTKTAFDLSEKFDTPVLLRTTTRVSHAQGLVPSGKRKTPRVVKGITKDSDRFVMLPAISRERRLDIERRMEKLRTQAETFSGNRIEWGDKKIGFITSGVSYLYVKEAFPEASVLKLGMVWPLPEKLISNFAKSVNTLYIVEELDPFLELHIKAMGISCTGKELLPSWGELNPTLIRQSITRRKSSKAIKPVSIPGRPPNLCAGCPHRGLFIGLSRLNVFVAGDIGCYTLAFLEPLSSIHSCVCMGASLGNALGMEKALGKKALGKVVAVIGDSTFIHSGMAGLIDIVYNKGFTTVIILDNRTTAMTGFQPNPVSGATIQGDTAPVIDLEQLCKAMGVKHVLTVNPHDTRKTLSVIKAEIKRPEPSVIISRAPCALLPSERKRKKTLFMINREKCMGCRSCIETGCPAIEWVPLNTGQVSRKKTKGYSRIIPVMCTGCAQCVPQCQYKAIISTGKRK